MGERSADAHADVLVGLTIRVFSFSRFEISRACKVLKRARGVQDNQFSLCLFSFPGGGAGQQPSAGVLCDASGSAGGGDIASPAPTPHLDGVSDDLDVGNDLEAELEASLEDHEEFMRFFAGADADEAANDGAAGAFEPPEPEHEQATIESVIGNVSVAAKDVGLGDVRQVAAICHASASSSSPSGPQQPAEPSTPAVPADPMDRLSEPSPLEYVHDAVTGRSAMRILRGEPKAGNVIVRCYRHYNCQCTISDARFPDVVELKAWYWEVGPADASMPREASKALTASHIALARARWTRGNGSAEP